MGTDRPGERLPLGELLVRRGALRPRRLLDLALAHQRREGVRLGQVLVGHRYASEEAVYRGLAEQAGLPFADAHQLSDADLEAARAVPAAEAIGHGLLPLRVTSRHAYVAFADPAERGALECARRHLRRPVVPVVAAPRDLRRVQEAVYEDAILAESTAGLAQRSPEASAHVLLSGEQRRFLAGLGAATLLAVLLLRTEVLVLVAGLIVLAYAAVAGFRLFLTYQGARHGRAHQVTPAELAALDDAELPMYTVLCPLYKEAGVLPQLVKACSELDYPKSKLEVKLLLEADDFETLEAVRRFRLPGFFEVVVVPAAGQRTKPKACNYGLQLARGEYTVIFDAEDVPEPDQLKKAICVFRRPGGERLACVQAKLNYYNARQNWLTGWFTLEYTAWFDFFLPALERLGLPVPLGGSSNHLPTALLRRVGAWDANNVTEDADLGLRLFRLGYRTAVLESTTWEEANSDFVNWVRQRSRWGKGYFVTWLIHMRHPLRTARELGWAGFGAMQLLFAGTYVVALLNLLMWVLMALWVLGQFAFIAYMFPGWIYYLGMLELLVGNFFFLYLNVWSASARGNHHLSRVALLTPFYWLMISVAMLKAALQLRTRSAYWEKTVHGLYVQPARRGVGALGGGS